MLVHICLERFPKNSFKKIHAYFSSLFQIVRKTETNTCVIDLPTNFKINPIFNIETLLSYRGTFEPSSLSVDLPKVAYQRCWFSCFHL